MPQPSTRTNSRLSARGCAEMQRVEAAGCRLAPPSPGTTTPICRSAPLSGAGCSQAAVLLEPAHQTLDRVAPPVLRRVEHRWTTTPTTLLARWQASLWDHGSDLTCSQPRPDTAGVVATVGQQTLRSARGLDERTDRLELGGLAALPGRDMHRQRQAASVADQMDFGRQSSTAASERLRCGPACAPLFRAPEATREARTIVASTIHVVHSMWPSASSFRRNAFRIRSNVPSSR